MPEATEITTYKCEGCGQRKLDGTQLSFDDREPTVCCQACYEPAMANYYRQRYDRRILALVGN